jgi:4-hydroxy-2-oxoheptanedioate aldolase
MKSRRTLHERLAGRSAVLGLLQAHESAAITEMAALCGYDFVLLDDEHGLFDPSDILQSLRAVSFSDMAVLVRVRGHDLAAIGRYLDLGADGIVVPNVTTADQARALARAVDYPPAGTRGAGAASHRVAQYGLSLSSHQKAPRAGTSLIVIIESSLGVANVDSILAVDGVDGAIIGPADLSADLGCAADLDNPTYAEAVAAVESAVSACNKILGTVPHAGLAADGWLARGHRLLILGSEISLIREAMLTQVAKARDRT